MGTVNVANPNTGILLLLHSKRTSNCYFFGEVSCSFFLLQSALQLLMVTYFLFPNFLIQLKTRCRGGSAEESYQKINTFVRNCAVLSVKLRPVFTNPQLCTNVLELLRWWVIFILITKIEQVVSYYFYLVCDLLYYLTKLRLIRMQYNSVLVTPFKFYTSSNTFLKNLSDKNRRPRNFEPFFIYSTKTITRRPGSGSH